MNDIITNLNFWYSFRDYQLLCYCGLLKLDKSIKLDPSHIKYLPFTICPTKPLSPPAGSRPPFGTTLALNCVSRWSPRQVVIRVGGDWWCVIYANLSLPHLLATLTYNRAQADSGKSISLATRFWHGTFIICRSLETNRITLEVCLVSRK